MKLFILLFLLSFMTLANTLSEYKSTENAGLSKGERIDRVETYISELGKKMNDLTSKKITSLESELRNLKKEVNYNQQKKVEAFFDKKISDAKSSLTENFQAQIKTLEDRLRTEIVKDYEENKKLLEKLLERLAVLEKTINDV